MFGYCLFPNLHRLACDTAVILHGPLTKCPLWIWSDLERVHSQIVVIHHFSWQSILKVHLESRLGLIARQLMAVK